MNTPRIENSERGVTITKGLAWTIVAGLFVGGLAVLSENRAVSAQQDAMIEKLDQIVLRQRQDQTRNSARREALELRVRVVENAQSSSEARFDERFVSVLQALGRIEARLDRAGRTTP